MTRLYLRFYLTLLASLLLFAIAVAYLWHRDGGPFDHVGSSIGQFAQNILPPADADVSTQQAALQRLTTGLAVDVSLFDTHGRLIGATGRALAAPPLPMAAETESSLQMRGSTSIVHLADGRWLSARTGFSPGRPMAQVHAMLLLLALVVGIAAFPVVRQLTKRLERLQHKVESLGAGDLTARVVVEGRDEVARLAASFNRTASQIEQLVATQKSLLSNASHELRTPLARIQLALELISDTADDRLRAGIRADIKELDGLIDDILLASRLDAPNDHLHSEDMDLLVLAAEECARYDDIDLQGESAPIFADARLIRHLLRNLLDNARIHGKPPTQVHIAMERGLVTMTVWDAGPGVAAEEFERIFLPFYRSSTTASHTGTGLGLALVRQIAVKHGADIRCEARPAGGSCFVFRLPVSELHQALKGKQQSPSSGD